MEIDQPIAPVQLTERQRDVVLLMRDGRSDAQIAAALGISVNTVRHHLRAIGKKLKSTDRIVIVVRAIMLGIIGLPLPADVLADLDRFDDPDEPVE